MTIVTRYIVLCDYVDGSGHTCCARLDGDGNAVKAVKEARDLGWSVRRHKAYCSHCVRTGNAPPEDRSE